MLIQQIAGAACAALVENPFGFRAAKPRPIGRGLLLRPIPRGALPKLPQIDQIPHAGPPHAIRPQHLWLPCWLPVIWGSPVSRVKSQVRGATLASNFRGHGLVSSVVI